MTLILNILRKLLLGVLGLVILCYGVLTIAMQITESRWLRDAPFHAAIDTRSTQPHRLTLIDSGVQSLAERLRLINSAQESIDLEFFIYDLDDASRVTSRALIERAKAGVAVRVLVDFSLPVFELRPAYAERLRAAGIQVRYYNTASIARLFSVQHRTHRKLLLVDGEHVILGGRNVADDYFDLSTDYNFLDSDLLLEGPIVADIAESFDLYWDSPWTEDPPEQAPDAITDFLDGPAEQAAIARVNQHLQSAPNTASHTCSDVRFVTDYPGAAVANRRVYDALAELLGQAQQRVLAESPYFVLQGDGLALTKGLMEKGLDITVLTNSLYATDAYYTVAPLYLSLDNLATLNLSLHAYQGAPPPDAPAASQTAQRWGVHSKRAVIDSDTISVGTYNVDPRSANLNAELLVVCQGSVELADAMRADIEARLARSRRVLGDGEVSPPALLGDASWKSIAMMWLIAPIASLFSFLL